MRLVLQLAGVPGPGVCAEGCAQRARELGRALTKDALQKLAPLKDEPEIARLQRQLTDLSNKLNLWSKILKQIEANQLKDACGSLRKYFAIKTGLNEKELAQALKLRDREFSDAQFFQECQN